MTPEREEWLRTRHPYIEFMLDHPAREVTIAEVDLMRQWVSDCSGAFVDIRYQHRFVRWIQYHKEFILNEYRVWRWG